MCKLYWAFKTKSLCHDLKADWWPQKKKPRTGGSIDDVARVPIANLAYFRLLILSADSTLKLPKNIKKLKSKTMSLRISEYQYVLKLPK